MTEEEQSKREWEPKPGDPVALLGGGWQSTVTMAEVLRLTKTQIVVKAVGSVGASEVRFRRAEPWRVGREDDYPRYRQVGQGSGRWTRSQTLTHPEAQGVLSVQAENERRNRLNAVLDAQDAFRSARSTEAAQTAAEALQDFIKHEKDASGV